VRRGWPSGAYPAEFALSAIRLMVGTGLIVCWFVFPAAHRDLAIVIVSATIAGEFYPKRRRAARASDAAVRESIEAEPAYQQASFIERLTGSYLPKRYADSVARSQARERAARERGVSLLTVLTDEYAQGRERAS